MLKLLALSWAFKKMGDEYAAQITSEYEVNEGDGIWMVDRRVRLKEESYILFDWLCLNGSSKSEPVNIDKYCAWAEEHTERSLPLSN
jgi:hypothetical protein